MLSEVESLDQYMEAYGAILGMQVKQRVKPLHTPGVDKVVPINTLRKPFPAQEHVVSAAVKLLNEGEKAVVVVGECGSGKTLMMCSIAHAHANGKPYRGIVFCPPHLVSKWGRELYQTIPDSKVHTVSCWSDVIALAGREEPTGPEWWVISENTAKLGPAWSPVFTQRRVENGKPNKGYIYCPTCSRKLERERKDTGVLEPLTPADLEKRRMNCMWCETERCGGGPRRPTSARN
jgi:hypothetical protein